MSTADTATTGPRTSRAVSGGTMPGALLLFCLVLLPACAATAVLGAEIRIGACGALSGPASAYGISMIRGATLAVEELNRRASDDVYALFTADDEQSETLTSERVTSLVYDDKVVAMVGTTDSGCTHVAARIAMKARVPLIATVATDPSITRLGNRYVFRNLADDRIQGQTLVDYIVRNRGRRRLVVAHVDTRYGRGGASVVETAAGIAGASLLDRLAFEKGRKDFSALASRIAGLRPDALVIWGLYAEGAALTRAVRRLLPSLEIFGPDGLVAQAYIDQAGRAAEGVVVTYPFDPGKDDVLVRKFVKAFRDKYSVEADSFAAHAYDAVFMIAEAAAKSGPRPAAIRDELARLKDFHGVTGIFSFDREGNSTLPVMLAVVRNGSFLKLRP